MPPTMMIPLAQIIYEYADTEAVIGFVPEAEPEKVTEELPEMIPDSAN